MLNGMGEEKERRDEMGERGWEEIAWGDWMEDIGREKRQDRIREEEWWEMSWERMWDEIEEMWRRAKYRTNHRINMT
jgi:hypothetical protein